MADLAASLGDQLEALEITRCGFGVRGRGLDALVDD